MLQLENVVKTFGALRAVDGVSLKVEKSTITGLIGPNGAGKTTLFNAIAGNHVPDGGSIMLGGQEIAGLRADQVFHRGLGRTFQIPRPLGTLTVLENMLLVPGGQVGEKFWNTWLRRGRVRAQDAANLDKAREVVEFVGLASLADQPARVLSGGQQKLLELARILMVNPSVILLDEPAAGVNPVLLETLIERIVELNRRGITFLLIEHNMDMVMRLCNPVIVMAQGKVVMQGTPDEVRRDPRVVEAYLGDQP
ncbi:MAG: ABC transporter ATP-binding protein [Polaromonas sp.]|uniref:ABC transporter ATP-binding protein n=1 Tax=Polaromonas sp. TaxID=1869339 RepID=UPI004036E5E9